MLPYTFLSVFVLMYRGGGRYVQDDSVSRIDCCFDKTAVQCILYITRKPSCRQGRGATAYTVPVIVLTFKVIHGR